MLTSKHGVHAPVGFHSGRMLPSYDKQAEEECSTSTFCSVFIDCLSGLRTPEEFS